MVKTRRVLSNFLLTCGEFITFLVILIIIKDSFSWIFDLGWTLLTSRLIFFEVYVKALFWIFMDFWPLVTPNDLELF